jgi:hypothetical protein
MRCAVLAVLLGFASGVVVADNITLDIQMAGYRFDQFDDKGPTSFAAFVREFRAFPWATQVGRSNGGSEPTISVKNHTSGTDLWVSAIGYQNQDQVGYDYLVGVVYQKQQRTLLGLGPLKNVRWVEMYIAEDGVTVETLFETFFNGTFEQLMARFHKLQKYSEMEARR